MSNDKQQPFDMPQFLDPVILHKLQRDWEHAFHVQGLQGRETGHLQQLMHSQFTFLEHVVLDLSKSIHSMQDQIEKDRIINQKLQEELNKVARLNEDSARKLQEFQIREDSSLKDLKTRMNRLEEVTEAHKREIQTMEASTNQQAQSFLQNSQSNKSEIDQWIRATTLNMGISDGKSKELLARVDALEREFASKSKETEIVAETMMVMKKATLKRFEETNQNLAEIEKKFKETTQSLRRAKQMEQETVNVIKIMSTHMTSLRRDLLVQDTKHQSRVDEASNNLMREFKKEMKSLIRPLIIQ